MIQIDENPLSRKAGIYFRIKKLTFQIPEKNNKLKINRSFKLFVNKTDFYQHMSCIDHKDITPLSKNGSIIAKLFKFNIDVFLLFLLTTIAYELGLHKKKN